jgi:hypothetical protein
VICPRRISTDGELVSVLRAVIALTLIVGILGKSDVPTAKTNGMREAIHHGVETIPLGTERASK